MPQSSDSDMHDTRTILHTILRLTYDFHGFIPVTRTGLSDVCQHLNRYSVDLPLNARESFVMFTYKMTLPGTMGFHKSTLVARGANTQIDPSYVSAPLATNVDLFVCLAECLFKSSSISY